MLVLAAEASDPLPVAIVLAVGFLLGAWGHAIRSTWLVAFGIALLFFATVLLVLLVGLFRPS